MTEDELKAIEAQASTWREDVEAHFRSLVAEVRRLTRERDDAVRGDATYAAAVRNDTVAAERDAALAKLAEFEALFADPRTREFVEAHNGDVESMGAALGWLSPQKCAEMDAKLAEVTRERDEARHGADRLAQIAAESQAREAELRVALAWAVEDDDPSECPYCVGMPGMGLPGPGVGKCVAHAALARLADRTALDAMLAEARDKAFVDGSTNTINAAADMFRAGIELQGPLGTALAEHDAAIRREAHAAGVEDGRAQALEEFFAQATP